MGLFGTANKILKLGKLIDALADAYEDSRKLKGSNAVAVIEQAIGMLGLGEGTILVRKVKEKGRTFLIIGSKDMAD